MPSIVPREDQPARQRALTFIPRNHAPHLTGFGLAVLALASSAWGAVDFTRQDRSRSFANSAGNATPATN